MVIAGDRPTWKDPNNLLRKNKITRITGVPTMTLLHDGKMILRLEGKDIADAKLRNTLFEEAKL